MPPRLVYSGAIVISITILTTTVIKATRPKTVTAFLDTAVRDVEEKFDDIGTGHSTEEVMSVRTELKRVRLHALELRRVTLRTSGSPWKEFCAFCRGHSVRVVLCTRKVEELNALIEIMKAEEEQRKIKAGEECMG